MLDIKILFWYYFGTMNKNFTKLQVPIDKDDLAGLKKRAQSLGFDSVQAYIRVWAKAVKEGRQLNFGVDDWGEPSDEAAARLNRWAEEAERDHKAGKLETFATVEEFMKDLRA